MPVVFRPARAEELQAAEDLVAHSINDLTERYGFGPIASSRQPHFQMFSLEDDPAGLWVAEEDGDLVGFAFSWVCGDFWFLAELFVAPGHQGSGIGDRLLQRTLEHAGARGATNKALITFAFNRASQGLYIRHGLFPRTAIYGFGVGRQALAGHLRGAPVGTVPLEDTPSHLQTLARIDVDVLGVSREKHHRYLIGGGAKRGVLLLADGDCIGYAYLSDGHIGPLAAAEPSAMAPVFRTVLHLAAESGASEISAFLPGASETALRTAIEHGMRITFPLVLMSERDFGDWTRYLPRNPGFM
jgi:ribosomal protein S18 acetylase RimI-like enzyme